MTQCDMGSCCDFDWSGWTGCCRNTRNQNVRLRFRGGCAGSPAEEVSKPCDRAGIVSDTCMVVIQNSFELGLINSGYNSTYVINPDEFINFQNQILIGQKLGHDDNSASAHSLDTTGYSTYTTVNGQNYYSNGEYSSYSMGAWERTWNGMMIRSTELEYQLINGQQVTGVFLESGEFIQG